MAEAYITSDTIGVGKCVSCGRPHNEVAITRYKAKTNYTHWYQCPSTNEPVSICLMTNDGSEATQVPNSVMDSLTKAVISGRYMVAVFRMEGNAQYLERTTSNFPTGEFVRSVKLLDENLTDEAGPPPQQELPAAARPNAPVKLFASDE